MKEFRDASRCRRCPKLVRMWLSAVGEQVCVFGDHPPEGETQSDCYRFDLSAFGTTEKQQEAKNMRKTDPIDPSQASSPHLSLS